MGQVLDHKARHVHRVLGGGVGRRIGQIQILQLQGRSGPRGWRWPARRSACPRPRAHDLGAQQAVCALLKHHLHGHDLAAGIVSGVAQGERYTLSQSMPACRAVFSLTPVVAMVISNTLMTELPWEPDTGCPRRRCCPPRCALLVGGARQGEEGVLPGDEVLHLHRVPHSVDVRRGGLHPVVHQDAALDAQLQPGRLGRRCPA